MSGLEEIALALIVLFFSGVWSAIKYVDEYTDNKWVFFIPAGAMSLFLLSGIGEGFAFYACLLSFGPIIIMLIIAGIEQGGQKPSFSIGTSGTLEKKDLNRKLAPSYKRAYDRLMGYIQARGGEIKSIDEGVRRLKELGVGDAERFFSSPYVINALGLKMESSESSNSHIFVGNESFGSAGTESREPSEIEGDEWWEKGYDGGKDDSSSISNSSDESCGEPGCNNSVNAFDFRCFTCRKRFCRDHAGASIECSGCSK